MGAAVNAALVLLLALVGLEATAADLGPFRLHSRRLPTPLQQFGAAAVEDHLYVIGGCTDGRSGGACLSATKQVYGAQIFPDGGLSPFAATTPLPTARWEQEVHVIGRSLLVLGGEDINGPTNGLWADLLPDAGLSAWVAVPKLPSAAGKALSGRYGSSILFSKGGTSLQLETARLDTLPPGVWRNTEPLLTHRNWARLVELGGRLCTFGGFFGGAVGDSTCAGPDGDGGVTGWTVGAALPEIRSAYAATLIGDEVFLIGGSGSGANYDDVVIGSLDGGVIGSWSRGTHRLSTVRFRHEAVKQGTHLFVLGGVVADVTIDSIEMADIPFEDGGSVPPSFDAGFSDASDGGPLDGGFPGDPSVAQSYRVGCACGTSSESVEMLFIALVAVGLRRRFRLGPSIP